MRPLGALALLLLSLTAAATAVPQPESVELRLRTGAIRLERQPEEAWQRQHRRLLEEAATAGQSDEDAYSSPAWGGLRGAQQWLVAAPSLSAALLREVAEAACGAGGRASGVLPDNALLVVGPPGVAAACRAVEGVVDVVPLQPEHKVAPEWAAAGGGLPGKGGRHGALWTSALRDGSKLFHLEVVFPERLPQPWQDAVAAVSPSLAACHARDAPEDAGAAAAQDWPAALHARFGAGGSASPAVARTSPASAQLTVSQASLRGVLAWLAAQPAVQWVGAPGEPLLANYQAITIDQIGDATSRIGVLDGSTRPLWAAGLTGAGQIVGCGDSGLDVDHCAFGNMDLERDFVRNGSDYYHSGSGKVKAYRVLNGGDTVDDNGHGTHVAGTIAGNPPAGSGLESSAGMAKDAQLLFTDMGSGAAGGLSPPADMVAYYQWGWDLGARVFSESWGTTSNVYDSRASSLDRFAYEHPDHLAVIAAGNFGGLDDAGNDKDATLGSPGTAKNSLTVGAGLSPIIEGWTGQRVLEEQDRVYRLRAQAGHLFFGSTVRDNDYSMQLAYFGPAEIDDDQLGEFMPLAAAQPPDACSPLTNAAEVDGAVVMVVTGGDCSYVDKALAAQAAGAQMVIVSNNGTSGFIKLYPQAGEDASGVAIPVASMPRITSKRIWTMLRAVREAASIRVDEALKISRARERHLAPYSSVGPTQDGRFKPDLVAPGALESALSDGVSGSNQCTLVPKRGTSMATPQVGGAAALVRQYFMDGFYPTKARGGGPAYEPSGPLIKAVLLASTKDMDGLQSSDQASFDGVPLEPPPGMRQGFGRMNTRGIPLEDTKWRLQVLDRVPIEEGDTHTFCVEVDPQLQTGRIRAVLVWHDPPPLAGANKTLVNDLDLTMLVPELNGLPILGNAGAAGLLEDGADTVNNVELTNFYAQAGVVTLQVKGSHVPMPQNYSLAVFGEIAGDLVSMYNPGYAGEVDYDAASTECISNLSPVMLLKPQVQTREDSAVFRFVPPSGRSDIAAAYDCRLLCITCGGDPENKDTWETVSGATDCTSGLQIYNNLSDEAYFFAVRPSSNLDAESSWTFVVDTTPPEVAFQGDFPLLSRNGTARLAFDAPNEDFGAQFQCRLTQEGGGSVSAPIGELILGISTADFDVCQSPLSISNVPQGAWSIEIIAEDGAHNVSPEPLVTSFLVDQDESKVFVQLTSRVPDYIREVNLTYPSIGIDFVPGHNFSDKERFEQRAERFECKLIMVGTGEDATGPPGADAQSWQPCEGQHTLRDIEDDGMYEVQVRSATPGGRTFPAPFFATGVFVVDRQPPSVELTEAPADESLHVLNRFALSASEPGVRLFCALLPSFQAVNMSLGNRSDDAVVGAVNTLADPGALDGFSDDVVKPSMHGWRECSSPIVYVLAEDTYMFAAYGTDRAGWRSDVQWHNFTVKGTTLTEAPLSATIDLPSTPICMPGCEYDRPAVLVDLSGTFKVDNRVWASRDTNVRVTFDFEGLTLTNTVCSMDRISFTQQEGLLLPSVTGSAYAPCVSGQTYQLDPGLYAFKVVGQDAASGEDVMSPAEVIVVDVVSPTVSFTSRIAGKQPAAFQVDFVGIDPGTAFTPVDKLCMLRSLENGRATERNVSAPLQEGINLLEAQELDARYMLGVGNDDGAVRTVASDAPASKYTWVYLGQWMPCAAGSLRFMAVPPGSYEFRVQAADAAGNPAVQVSTGAFEVDDTLPLPVWAEEFDEQWWEDIAWWQWALIGVGALAVLCCLLGICICTARWCCCRTKPPVHEDGEKASPIAASQPTPQATWA